MPRCVRNFWIDLEVDGRANKIGTGPRSSGGGFFCTVLVREEGTISDKSLRIRGDNSQGDNILSVELLDGNRVVKEITLQVPRDVVPEPKSKTDIALKVAKEQGIPVVEVKAEIPSRLDAFWKISDGEEDNDG